MPTASSVGAATAMALVACAAAWAVGSHDADDDRAQQRQAGDVVLTRFEGRAEQIVRSVAVDPRTMAPARAIAGAVSGVARVPASAAGMPGSTGFQVVFGRVPAGVDVPTAVTAARTAMELARDTGTPHATQPVGDVVLLAVAEYAGGTVPDSTVLRRTSTVAWRLAFVLPARLMDGVPLPAGASTELLAAASDSAHDHDMASTALVGGQPWQLSLDLPATSRVTFGAVTTLLIGLVGALLFLLTGTRSQRALLRERAASTALERETRTVAELGPLLQSSLDLAEVLPAAALRLSDEFGLSRLAVQLHGDSGRLVDVFALGGGSGNEDEEVPLTATTPELAAGVPASLPLLRAGRTIGRLSLTSRRPLQQAQIAALSAAADLIAVATYNVELYEREQASVRRLRDLDQLKDAFLGTISHELRTPITAIGGFVRLLRDRWGQITEDQRLEFLDRVYRNSISLGLLVDDLLDFARLERQALNAPAAPMELDQHVASTVAQLTPILGDREIVTELEPVRALANTGALERVLANLLTNAVKFSPDDSRIVVRVTGQPTTATVEVCDEGAGIAPADRDHVFTRFYRGDSDAARGTRGAGIGLAVVRELVKQMGGQVEARANAPRGTRMVVTLARDTAATTVADLPTQERRDEPVAPALTERSGT